MRYWLFVISSIIILTVVALTALYLRAYLRDDVIVDVSGSIDMDFRVIYLENDLYGTIPTGSHFYMSFTDYIEITSDFNINLASDSEVYWWYTATERLVIRYANTISSTANPIMFEEIRILSEVSGSVSEGIIPSGTYVIDPRTQIYRYRDIVTEKLRQIYGQGISNLGFRGLGADFLIDFTYTIHIPSLGMIRSVTSGYRLPLNMEVYTLVATGSPNFSESVNIIAQELPFELTMPVVIAFVTAMLMSAYCLFRGIKQIQANPNERIQEAKTIIKKYDSEIVMSNIPLPLSSYTHIPVDDFKELVKLAINRNGHITCYHDANFAEFAIIVKEHAYYYLIKFMDDLPTNSVENPYKKESTERPERVGSEGGGV